MTAETRSLIEAYRLMFLIRRVEEEAARAYAQGKIGGFLHLYIGQEAVAVGAELALEKTDYAITTYRDHGLALARGMTARTLMCELFGKAPGCSQGLGGSMHVFDVANRMMGGYGIVGGHLPLAAGMAFAGKYRKDGTVTICFFGDGSVPMGEFHESLHLAALWKLPVVFVCENNQYSMGTPLDRTMPVKDVTAHAAGYGMAKDRFPGDDVVLVRDRLAAAITRARNESLPTLIEIETYRYRGHSMSDPGKYRTAAEVDEHKKNDPVRKLRDLLAKDHAEAELAALEASVEDEVKDAVAFADAAPQPTPDVLEPATYSGPFAR